MHDMTTTEPLEQGTLARECAAAFGRMLDYYRKYHKADPAEALKLLRGDIEEEARRICERPADQIDWHDLDHLAELSPPKALEVWEGIKRQALDELRSGHRAGKAMQSVGANAWERAQFLAIRQELAEEWQPRNGIERQ